MLKVTAFLMRSHLDSSGHHSNTYLEAILIAKLEDHLSPLSCRVCGIEDLKERLNSFVRRRRQSPCHTVGVFKSFFKKARDACWETHRYLASLILQIGLDIPQGC